jgi:hypothetical protein
MHTDRSQHAPSRSRWLLAAALLAAVLVPASAWAHTTTKPAPHKQVKAHPSAGATAVMVHGLWTITVRNPNGTLASRRTFENSFTNPALLASVLTGGATAGLWGIELDGGDCLISTPASNGPGSCALVEASDPSAASPSSTFHTLIVTDTGNDITLAGSATATFHLAAAITSVTTYLNTCPVSSTGPPCSSASAFAASTPRSFTGCNFGLTPACIGANGSPITAPIAVKPNQQVAVNVVISFT